MSIRSGGRSVPKAREALFLRRHYEKARDRSAIRVYETIGVAYELVD